MNPSTPNGASNASDFQPLTQNPQGNVGGGLQPTSPSSNVFNQPDTNPQALPQVNSLQVANNGTKVTDQATNPSAQPLPWALVSVILVAAVLLVALFYALSKKGGKPAEDLATEAIHPVTTPKKSPKSNPKKKQSRAKRKGKKKTSK